MIRVELLGRPRRWLPWSKALLAALVVCGGLYGFYHFLYSGSASSPVVQQETAPSPVQEVPSSPVVQQETAPSPVQEVAPSSATQQETAPSPVQEAPPSPVAQREIPPESAAEQEEAPNPAVVPQEIESSPAPRQEAAPSPVVQQEKTKAASPSPEMQQDTASSRVQGATPRPQNPAAPALQRSTACHQSMRIAEQVPAGLRVASLNCNSTGEYWLEGTSPSYKVLRAFRLRLRALPSRVSFSTWLEERTLRFAFQGRFAERPTPPLAALSADQAEQFLGKVARWADASGLDSLSIHAPIHLRSAPGRSQQRQKLRGIGAPLQIDAFLQQFQQAEGVATLGEVLLMPVKSDEHGWVAARLYAAVDIVVDEP